MKEAILKIQINEYREVSVFASIDGVEECIFCSEHSKRVLKDATIIAREWLLELRQAKNGQ
ncbi:hypothetical protein [Cardiobacterium valvarum]|uniref:Toxin-antitoxin system, antitoxin component, HicB domain protein n=1 Tax=Cardiobacterium valvarum F0432 TaxID=797473 RepID=G9ZJ83_9GAMM|nr:hypothetical protein [Cardiobacterium valvarum]EHM50224.1 hypothetical protein HMPREF9080_02852 [Cardiobacterium valvarum F0432]